MNNPFVWQMIEEAIDNLDGKATYKEIKSYIYNRWGKVNESTINDQIQVVTVNHKSRIHYPENTIPRLSNTGSNYDFLFSIGKGEVVKYEPKQHGVWEIYFDENGKLSVRLFKEIETTQIYTPSDIIWIKNVTNTERGEAYLDINENTFTLNFPTKHKTNVLSPKVDELILLRQKINGVPAFTHIVTPIDQTRMIDESRPDYKYGRVVKTLAKTNINNFIRVDSTLWKRLKFGGISQGNACKIETVKSAGNISELQFDIWEKFTPFFVPSEQLSTQTTSALLSEIKLINDDFSVIEGDLKLVSHFVKERNKKIIEEKKSNAIKTNSLICEVCNFSFHKIYSKQFIECHHLEPIGQNGIRETKLDGLALVCSNCHRMLHVKFDGKYLSIEQLRKVINGQT